MTCTMICHGWRSSRACLTPFSSPSTGRFTCRVHLQTHAFKNKRGDFPSPWDAARRGGDWLMRPWHSQAKMLHHCLCTSCEDGKAVSQWFLSLLRKKIEILKSPWKFFLYIKLHWYLASVAKGRRWNAFLWMCVASCTHARPLPITDSFQPSELWPLPVPPGEWTPAGHPCWRAEAERGFPPGVRCDNTQSKNTQTPVCQSSNQHVVFVSGQSSISST